MEKGFGIAALICAVLAIFIPFYGVIVSAIAIALAVIAAANGDRVFAAATPLVVGVNTFFMSPVTWYVMANAGVHSGTFGAVVLGAIIAPFAVIVVKSAEFQAWKNKTVEAPDYRKQAASSAPESNEARSWREAQWREPGPSAGPARPTTARTHSDPPKTDPFTEFMAGVADKAEGITKAFFKDAAAKGAGISANQVKGATRRYAPSPQVLLFILLVVAAVAFVPEIREAGMSAVNNALSSSQTFVERYGTLMLESAALVVLGGLFFKFGKGSGIFGGLVCLMLIGYLTDKEFDWVRGLRPAQIAIARTEVSSSDKQILDSLLAKPSPSVTEPASLPVRISMITVEFRSGAQFFYLKPDVVYQIDMVPLPLRFSVTRGQVMFYGEKSNSDCSSNGFDLARAQGVQAMQACSGVEAELRADLVY